VSRLLSAVLAVLVAAAPTAAQPVITATPSTGNIDVPVGEEIRFWVSVRNAGTAPAVGLRVVRVDADGFRYRLAQPCGCQDAACLSSTACMPLRERLAAGEHAAFDGVLIPSRNMSARPAWVILWWSDLQNRPQQLAVPLGRFTATSRGWLQLLAFTTFLKDIAIPAAIPVALALLGYWFQRTERERTERLAQLERERAERLAEEGHRRTEIAQTWREMLPLSHGYSIEHYMPVVSAAISALRDSAEAAAKGEENPDKYKLALYSWTLFWRRIRAQMDVLYGFYFKDRCGEETASVLLARLARLYFKDRPDSEKRRETVFSLVEPSGTDSRFATFTSRWETQSAQGSATARAVDAEFQAFVEWMKTPAFRDSSDTLDAFATIVKYEMNRVYQPWYGKPERMSMNEGATRVVWSVAGDIAARAMIPQAEVEEYLTASGCPRPVSPIR
jgi:hypothetical protein